MNIEGRDVYKVTTVSVRCTGCLCLSFKFSLAIALFFRSVSFFNGSFSMLFECSYVKTTFAIE